MYEPGHHGFYQSTLRCQVIELVAGEFGHTVEFIDMEKQMEMEEEEDEDEDEDLQPVLLLLPSWVTLTMVKPHCLTIYVMPM
jgi:hypothetical protein